LTSDATRGVVYLHAQAVTESSTIIKLGGNLNENNWIAWQAKMKTALETYGVLNYIAGTVTHPDINMDHQGWKNWGSNNAYTHMQIQCNLQDVQMVHINQCKTAFEMWRSLEGVHDNKGHQALVIYMRNLYCLTTKEGDNIVEHLNKMKEGCKHINLMGDTHFYIPNITFKLLICQSLPQLWDNYMDAYIGSQTFTAEDPCMSVSSQHFICILKNEYNHHKGRKMEPHGNSQQVNFTKTTMHSLVSHISSQPSSGRTSSKNASTFCKLCNILGHPTDKCTHFEKRCHNCNHFGHKEATCCFEKITWKRKTGGTNHPGRGGKRRHPAQGRAPKNEETAHIKEMEEVVFQTTEHNNENPIDTESYNNFHSDIVITYDNGETLIYYNCLADSATTSHISNCQEAFITFKPAHKTLVGGVSSIKMHAEGQGTIQLKSVYKGQKYTLTLKDILYIPRNKNNLISLGHWEAAGGKYTGHNGKLMLTTKSGSHITQGPCIANNLYNLRFTIKRLMQNKTSDHIFATQETPSWETWHKRFSHIGYTGIQKMYELGLVDGFDVDVRTPKPDCITCTEGKLTIKPFNKSATRIKEVGQLTHIDLWGKYDKTSLHGRQYYILFVDNHSCYTTIKFLKAKSQASEHVKAYITYLQKCRRKPQAIHVNHGKEFINKNLKSWCHQQGIEINQMAPYSPLQNGIAKQMNHTLVELAHTMHAATDLHEYLWEEATAHAAYLQNQTYTIAVKGSTPYQKWHRKRPNMAHLHEFSPPIWVLLQGQKVPRKMLPKPQHRSLISFDDRLKSVLYYNPEMQKVLTLRNFCFLNPPMNHNLPEEIGIHPDTLHEGEIGTGMQNAIT